jgi:hypothetical protein
MGAASLWPIFKGFETMVSLLRIRPTVVFFWDEISPKFDLKNLILTYTKDFSGKKWPKFARFQRIINPNCQILMISFNT